MAASSVRTLPTDLPLALEAPMFRRWDRSAAPPGGIEGPGEGGCCHGSGAEAAPGRAGSVPPMDIEEFYDADDRRRRSAEIELGTEWRDKAGVRYELNWVEDTGELYVMREPAPYQWEDPFGGIHVNVSEEAPADGMTVAVVARIATHDQLRQVLAGWEDAMGRPDSTGWLEARLTDAGLAIWSENAPE